MYVIFSIQLTVLRNTKYVRTRENLFAILRFHTVAWWGSLDTEALLKIDVRILPGSLASERIDGQLDPTWCHLFEWLIEN